MSIPSITDRLEAATAKAEGASQIMHDVANGGPAVEVLTESGPVPSIQKWFADLNDRTSGAVGQVEAALEDEVLARQQLGGRVDSAILSFTSLELATAAAATLSDGQEIESPDESGVLTRYKVSGSELVFVDLVADEVALGTYADLRSYGGRARRVCVTGLAVIAQPNITGNFIRDDSDTATADNGGTVIVDNLGRRWKRVLGGFVNPEWFGAKADGTTNDASAIQSAINNSAGKSVKFSKRTYKCNSGLTLPAYTSLDLREGATIDFSAAGLTETLFRGAGSAGSAVLLTADAALGAESISVASSAGLSVGDPILIRSEATWSSVAEVKAGEIQYIASISGGTIGLSDRLYDGYTVANGAAIQKIAPLKNISIKGGRFLGAGVYPVSSQTFLGITYGENIKVRGVKAENFGLQDVELESCVKVFVENNDLGYIRQAAQNSYGVTLWNACQWVSIANNHFNTVRAGVSSGGRGGVYGYVRNVTVTGNTFYGVLGGAVRSHAGTEHWAITGNTIQAGESAIRPDSEGILFRGVSAVITGNSIYNTDGTAIRCTAQAKDAPRPSSFVVSGNQIVGCGRSGIIVTSDRDFPGTVVKGVVIGSNHVTGWARTASTPAIDINSEGGNVYNISVTGNVCMAPAMSARACLIRSFANTIRDGAISGNVFDNGASTTETLILVKDAGNIGGFAITGNRAFGGTYGIRRSGADSVPNFVSGNIASGSAGGVFGFIAAELGTNVTI